jgi:hypothetical protein
MQRNSKVDANSFVFKKEKTRHKTWQLLAAQKLVV